MDLARIAWLATVFACLVAVLILVLQGYYGYAGVTLRSRFRPRST